MYYILLNSECTMTSMALIIAACLEDKEILEIHLWNFPSAVKLILSLSNDRKKAVCVF